MSFLHSFWTTISNISDLKGGFPDAKFHLMSWALSSLQIRQFYDKLTLYTDNFGKELLIERLGLPYSAVHLDLEGLDFGLPKQLWTPKKMYAYALQNEPFLHIDGDVFIWQPLEESLLSAPLVAQNLDINMDFYKEVLQTVLADFPYIPDYVGADLGKDLIAANAGVIGGNNYLFFKEYVKEASLFLEKNRAHLEKINLDYLSTFTEQYLFYAFARHRRLAIKQVVAENVSPAYFPENTVKNLIQEVAGFEFEKQDFVANLSSNEVLEAYFKAESIKVNQALSLPIETLLEKEICISPYAKFIETAWNWAETNEFAMQKHGFDYLSNINKESAYFKVVLMLCVEQSTVIEMLLDVVNIMLFETTSEKQKIKDVIYQVISQVKTYIPDKTDAELSNILISKISYFLYHHVLRLV